MLCMHFSCSAIHLRLASTCCRTARLSGAAHPAYCTGTVIALGRTARTPGGGLHSRHLLLLLHPRPFCYLRRSRTLNKNLSEIMSECMVKTGQFKMRTKNVLWLILEWKRYCWPCCLRRRLDACVGAAWTSCGRHK